MDFDESLSPTSLPSSSAVPVESKEDQAGPTRNLFARELIETALLTLFIFWIVNSATGRFRIEGYSMLPTLEEGEYIIINKLSYYLEEPERGDIIVLQFPNDRSRDFIKRIIGLPGDHIEVRDGVVHVNGVALEEPYINAEPTYSGTWDVPADEFFVLGDNRNNSSDSHSWSYLPRSDIIGKAWLIYWEPDKWGLVAHYPHELN
ncbi:MAG: signal peptidase I [Candidatus Promineifilaceae bacterium]